MALPALLVIPIGIGLRYVAKRVATAVIARAGTAAGTAARTGAQAGRVGGVLGDIAADGDIGDIEQTGDVIGSTPQSREDTDDDALPIPGEASDADTDECADTDEDCNDCEPRNGEVKPYGRNFSSGDGRWVEYQLRIANRSGHPVFAIVRDNVLEEWVFNRVQFDGFWSNSCTLIEAKHGYGNHFTKPDSGDWYVEDKPWSNPVPEFFTQALSQNGVVQPHSEATLQWYFSHPGVKELTEDEFLSYNLRITCIHEPL